MFGVPLPHELRLDMQDPLFWDGGPPVCPREFMYMTCVQY